MKENKKSFNTIIKNDVYPYDIMFSLNQTDKEINDEFLKYWGVDFDVDEYGLDDEQGKHGRTTMLKSAQILLRLTFWPDTPEGFGILQHEIFHAAEFILNYAGIKLSNDSDEAYAYFIECLTRKIYEILFPK